MDTLIGQPEDGGALIKDSDTSTFVADVIEASSDTPVIVDFWAPWCGPCKQLGPALEKAVRAAQGKVKLVKVNIDESPQIAQQLRIQSIPAVFAFSKGQPVDGFVGALPESQLKSFIERLVGPVGPTPIEQALQQAKAALDADDFTTATNIYMQILKQAPDEAAAIAGLARCRIGQGEIAAARELLDSVDNAAANDPEVEGAKAALALAEKAAQSGDTAEFEAKLAANPNDHQARYDLAMAHYAAGRNEEAIEELVEIVRREKAWDDEAARKMLLQIFDALGPTDPATVAGRRKLSSVLFA